jgi:hypothetical protein
MDVAETDTRQRLTHKPTCSLLTLADTVRSISTFLSVRSLARQHRTLMSAAGPLSDASNSNKRPVRSRAILSSVAGAMSRQRVVASFGQFRRARRTHAPLSAGPAGGGSL